MNRLLLIMLGVLFCAFQSLGQVTIRIDASNSPYNIANDLTINASDSLIIGPGAEIYLEDGVDIRVYGAISIKGTKEFPVIMKGVDPVLGWGQIFVETPVDSLIVEHAIIENGRFLVMDCHTRFSDVHFENRQNLEWNHAIVRLFYGSLIVNECEIIGTNKGEGFLCHNIPNPILVNNYFERIPDAVELLNCTDGRVGKSIFRDMYDDAIDLNNCANTVLDSNIIYGILDRGMEIGSEGNGSSSGILVYRNLIVNSGKGINFKEGSSGLIENNTLHGNGIGVSALVSGTPATASNVEVINCIFSKNGSPVITEGGSTVTVSYSSSTNLLFPGAGNFVDDPMFTNPEAGDFSLRFFSPCIDKGAPMSTNDPDNTRRDLGVHYQTERLNAGGYQNGIKVWPNPTSDVISIHMQEAFDRVILFDYLGKKQLEVQLYGQPFLEQSLKHLSTGTYLLQFSNAEKSVVLKLVKR